jgi:hypothetical protein
MPSLLAVVVAGALFFDPPAEPPASGVVGSVIGGLPAASSDDVDERGGPPLAAAIRQATVVVLAEIVETHDVAETPVEEAEVRLVLHGDPGVSRVFYAVSGCGCGVPEKARPGTAVLLLLTSGEEVQQTRRFWQALDGIARPSEFFDVVWSGGGRLAAGPDGLVETWLSLPTSVPSQRDADGRGRPRARRVALDALVAWIQEQASATEEPLP